MNNNRRLWEQFLSPVCSFFSLFIYPLCYFVIKNNFFSADLGEFEGQFFWYLFQCFFELLN